MIALLVVVFTVFGTDHTVVHEQTTLEVCKASQERIATTGIDHVSYCFLVPTRSTGL